MESAITKVTREKAEVSAVRRSAPWWIWVVAASFVFNFALIIYLDFTGPFLGMNAAFTGGDVLVHGFNFPSPAAAAGVRAGDRIIRANGRPIASYLDWSAILSNLKVGEPVTFEIRRNYEYLNLSVIPQPRSFIRYPYSPMGRALLRFGELVMLGLACFLAFARPRNGAALMAALFFAGVSGTNSPEALAGIYTLLRGLPPVLFALFYISRLAGSLLPPLLFTFVVTFPRPLVRARWLWLLIWAPYVLLRVPIDGVTYRMIFNPDYYVGMFFGRLYTLLNMTSVVYLIAVVVALVVNYRRLTDINERRRVRILVFGSIAGLLAFAQLVLLVGQSTLRGTLFEAILLSLPVSIALIVLCFLVFPLSFVYSILRHRLFDVRIIIRQGLQYAMARRVLLSIMPLLVLILLADILLHGDQSLASIVTARGWMYGVVGAVAIVVYQKRQGWLDRIDRHFFRDRYDAQRLLQDVIQRVKEAKSLGEVGAEVVTRIQTALHSEFVCILHHSVDETEFSMLACEPARYMTPRLHADGKLMGLLRVMEKPLQFSGAAWLTDRLPRDEIQLVEQQRIDLIVPIWIGSHTAESMLVLGAKRSEEPYSREDERLLAAIAASLALVSTGAVMQQPDKESYQECPQCGACFNVTESCCNQDESGLVRVHMPRLLAGRYRLDRRIGSGGMGAVYAGVDNALDRPIAIKVIRPELVHDRHSTAKFHHEARAAAGLVHRNVITIYDFGVERQHPFIIMELLAGRTLRTELDPAKPFSPKRTIEILDGVCAAIEEAHRRKLLHRDLKPENIFLAQTPTGELVKVLDFGLVKALTTSIRSDDPTRAATSVIAGTPYYMAPEQLMGEPASQATDVWALGVIAYEMLIGAHPFVTGSEVSWQKAIFKGCFTSVRAHRQDVSPNWQAFFERVFQPEPKQRIGSAGIFLAELLLALKSADQKTKANS